MINFNYLKVYIPGGIGVDDNWFCQVTEQEIVNAESKLGQSFPSELRAFYSQIGYGMLRSPHIRSSKFEFYNSNEFLPPYVTVNFALGIREWYNQKHYISQEVIDYELESGDLPFFEIGDSCFYLKMKLNDINPNAIWNFNNIKISDSLREFVWRLYYESPSFYERLTFNY